MARTPRNYPKVPLDRGRQAQVAALAQKLVPDRTLNHGANPGRRTGEVDLSRDLFERISKNTSQEHIDADGIFQLLPDIKLSERIMVGSILSPRDMYRAELTFKIDENRLQGELARPLLQVVENYFRRDYKIDHQLSSMLEDILFRRGAYPLLVLPENNLDAIINGTGQVSTEAFGRAMERAGLGQSMGFIGPVDEKGQKVGLEQYGHGQRPSPTSTIHAVFGEKKQNPVSLGITVGDNFNILKRRGIERTKRQQRINQAVKRQTHAFEVSTEAQGRLSQSQIDQLYQQERPESRRVQNVVPDAFLSRKSQGHPLSMKIPTEAIIPVHTPGEPGDHVGYFLMLDEYGRFLTRKENKDFYGEIRSSFNNSNANQQSDIIRQTRDAFNGFQNNSVKDQDIDSLQRAYAKIVENNLLNGLANGMYDEDLDISFTEGVQRVMMERSFRNQQTQLLYVPAEFVVYMAFDYNDHGIGESLIAKSKILSSMRSVLMFADTMAAVRNAVGRKKVNVRIDAADPDPQKTLGEIQDLVMERAGRGFPIGAPNPDQTMSYLQRAGFDFNIDVEGENYPNTKVDFDDYTTNVQAGNPELQDRLRRQQISAFGMNPDLVDPTSSPDFAVSVVNNNLMMSRMVLEYQKLFTGFLTQFIQMFVRNSAVLRTEMMEVRDEHKTRLTPEQKKLEDDALLEEFIESISVTLPEPDTSQIEQHQSGFSSYTQFMDDALNAYITPDLFPPEMLARDPEVVNQVIATVRAYFQRQWLQNNNVLPELDQMSELVDGKSNFNLLDIQKGQYDSIGEAINDYVEHLIERRKYFEEKNGDVVQEEGSEESTEETNTLGADDFADPDQNAEEGSENEGDTENDGVGADDFSDDNNDEENGLNPDDFDDDKT